MSRLSHRAASRALVGALVAALVLPLAACAAQEQEQPGQLIHPDPESPLGLPELIGLEPIIKPATRVLSDDDLAALEPVELLDPDCLIPADDRPLCRWLLRFAGLPSGVKVGSVLVADASPASPHGLLASVESIDGSEVTAVEATLGDAIEQGEFVIEQQFTAADATSIEYAPGVSAGDGMNAGALGSPGGSTIGPGLGVAAPSLGAGLAFNFVVDAEVVAGVHATGAVGFDIGCGAYGGLTWKKVLGVPVYPNGAYFEAKCGASQNGSVTFTGGAAVSIEKHYELAVVNLASITFFIGPVPVVLVPQITVGIDASGKISASMSVGAGEHFSATVGIKYSDGFHVIKEFDSGFDKQVTTGSARLSLKGGVSLSQALLLYGVAGPRLTESLYLDLLGKPPGEKPIWCLKGGLKGSASIGLDLGITYLGWGPSELFDWNTELGCATNSKPTITVFSPDDGQVVYPGGGGLSLGFQGTAFDEEDGNLPITWSSSKDGALGSTKPGATLPLPKTLTLGTHTITATVTDGDGATTTKKFSIVVKDPSPSVAFAAKGGGGTWSAVTSLSGAKTGILYFRLVPTSPVPLVIPNCDHVAWSSTLTVTRVSNCDFKISLSAQGTFPVTATLIDDSGKKGTGTLTVTVGPPPSVISPQFGEISATGSAPGYGTQALEDGISSLAPGTTVALSIDYTNSATAGKQVRYAWSSRTTQSGFPAGAWTPIGTTDPATLGGSSRSFLGSSAYAKSFTYEFRVDVTDATTNAVLVSRVFTVFYSGPPA